MKVKLQEVLEALDGAGVDMEYYYDTKNEEILMIFDGMVEYYGAAEPPVRCGESHLSGLTEPPHFIY